MTTTKTRTMQGAYHRNCGCPRCYEGNAAWQRERRHGIADGTWQPLVDAKPARAHVEHLHAQGLSYTVIAQLADVAPATLSRLRYGVRGRPRTERLRPDVAAAILAVRPVTDDRRLPDDTKLLNRGTVRRIQALRAIGWPAQRLADYAGVSRRTITRATVKDVLEADTHRRIHDIYDLLHDQNPALLGVREDLVKRARTYTRNRKWAPPTAWDDIDRDDEPKRRGPWQIHYAPSPMGARSIAILENTAELAAQGEIPERIAQRIGMEWDSIKQTHRRADVPLPGAEAVA